MRCNLFLSSHNLKQEGDTKGVGAMHRSRSKSSCSSEGKLSDTSAKRRGVFSALKNFAQDKSGSYLVISALAMPVLLGAAALGTEVGYWMQQQQKMQDAADSAVFAAATYYGPNNTNST